jgi:hypothetical protein
VLDPLASSFLKAVYSKPDAFKTDQRAIVALVAALGKVIKPASARLDWLVDVSVSTPNNG